MLELKKYNALNANYRLAIDILSDLKLSTNLDNSDREKLFIEDVCKRDPRPSWLEILGIGVR